MPPEREKPQRRKFLLGALGVLAGGLGIAWLSRRRLAERLIQLVSGRNPDLRVTRAPAAEEPCVLTSRQVEGPFYFPAPERVDVTEDRAGRPFVLRLQLTRHPDCTPLAGAAVEIWHCDAEGVYSGYPPEISRDAWEMLVFFVKGARKGDDGELHVEPRTATTFLRGLQRTDAGGWVEFRTIFPGWYLGRVPHVHVRAVTAEGDQLTTQLYFEPAQHDRLYTTTPPYDRHGPCPTTLETDGVLTRANGPVEGVMLHLAWSDAGPLTAAARMAVERG
jgi:protocatechuate 3,4-dioxygenase beta subunit